MSTALIGHTGFVGSNIHRQMKFDFLYNSKNIDDIVGKSFDLVVCAGVPAVKWWANKNPEEDLAIIESILDKIISIKAKRFILISTIDTYPIPLKVNENNEIDINSVQPYGKHRLILEKKLKNNFENYNIIRLPGLFGHGLKKNIIFDMLNNNMVDKINLESKFQWYPLSRIWKDIETVISNDISLCNFAVEPIKTRKLVTSFFPHLVVGNKPQPTVDYDIHTNHAASFLSKNKKYILDEDGVMQEIAQWLKLSGVQNG